MQLLKNYMYLFVCVCVWCFMCGDQRTIWASILSLHFKDPRDGARCCLGCGCHAVGPQKAAYRSWYSFPLRCMWGALLPTESAPVFLGMESPWTLTSWPASSKHLPLSTGITGVCCYAHLLILLYCLWFKTIFKLKCFDNILPLPQVPPDPLPPPYHPTVRFFSKKNKKTKPCLPRLKKKKKPSKLIKYSTNWSPIVYWFTTEHEACPGMVGLLEKMNFSSPSRCELSC